MNPIKLSDYISILPYPVAQHYHICPWAVDDCSITLACTQIPDLKAQKQIRFLIKKELDFHLLPEPQLHQQIEQYYPEEEKQLSKLAPVHDQQAEQSRAPGAVYKLNEKVQTPVIRIVNDLLTRAVRIGVSDIHLEPTTAGIRVRYRIDGVLHTVSSIPKENKAEVLSRVKIMSNLDIAEKRRPQDGRIFLETNQKSVDVRVSTMPTPEGEKIVLRILDKEAIPLDLSVLGLIGRNYDLFLETIRKPHGLILVTGPTGSGKTTTLYAALKTIQSPEINISTVEDPIEYQIAGINQTHMKEQIGYTFANAIRTFLRQDPDVIMVGEIRDTETAKYAIQAAQTGHLVFSTLHTNDAPSAVTRLLEMGMEPFLVASTVTLVLAQRLVRKVCSNCATERSVTEEEKRWLDDFSNQLGDTVRNANGCDQCANTGYKGRIAVFEMMPVSADIQKLVTERAHAQKIAETAKNEGMKSLRESGILLVKEGVTTLEEVRREIG